MNQEVCYDQSWTKDIIKELEIELQILNELQHMLRANKTKFLEREDLLYYISQNADVLEASLIATKKALLFYMETMDAQLIKMDTYYENELRKNYI